MEKKISGIKVNGGILTTTLKELANLRPDPDFSPGDTVKVYFHIREGNRARIQVYEGIVTSMRGEGFSSTFTVRRVSHEVGVERIFPYHSPSIQKIEKVRSGRVRRARLFYLRSKSGKEGRVKEVFQSSKKGAFKESEKKKAESQGKIADVATPYREDGGEGPVETAVAEGKEGSSPSVAPETEATSKTKATEAEVTPEAEATEAKATPEAEATEVEATPEAKATEAEATPEAKATEEKATEPSK